jgi:hypothetical protein
VPESERTIAAMGPPMPTAMSIDLPSPLIASRRERDEARCLASKSKRESSMNQAPPDEVQRATRAIDTVHRSKVLPAPLPYKYGIAMVDVRNHRLGSTELDSQRQRPRARLYPQRPPEVLEPSSQASSQERRRWSGVVETGVACAEA